MSPVESDSGGVLIARGGASQYRSPRPKGEQRRQQVIRAATEIVMEQGPAAVTHRSVARRAGASLSATTYYFSGLEDLLAAAGEMLVENWVKQVESMIASISLDADLSADEACSMLVNAVIPVPEIEGTRAYFENLPGAGRSAALSNAIAKVRPALEEVVGRLLARIAPEVMVDPALIIAVIDGAAFAALSEGTEPRERAKAMVAEALRLLGADI